MTVRARLHRVIFETDTDAGKRFDLVLLWIILFSVLAVMLDSIEEFGERYTAIFFVTEWALTVIFTIEYVLRIWISTRPLKYMFSFWGFIDLLSVLPSYLSLVLAGYHYMLVVRIFRLLRVFRILKLARFNTEAQILIEALRASVYKISIFFMAVLAIVTFMGTIIYVVEGGREGFSSIPQSIYWAIVTVTTVGYGDIVPHTVMGKFISSIAMITGYVFIAVPTGIVTLEISRSALNNKKCSACNSKNESAANYCAQCGKPME